LAGNIELFGNTLLHKMHRATGSLITGIHKLQRHTGIIILFYFLLSAVLELSALNDSIKHRDSMTASVTSVLAVEVRTCLLEVPLLSH
jgi:hypothetical protein